MTRSQQTSALRRKPSAQIHTLTGRAGTPSLGHPGDTSSFTVRTRSQLTRIRNASRPLIPGTRPPTLTAPPVTKCGGSSPPSSSATPAGCPAVLPVLTLFPESVGSRGPGAQSRKRAPFRCRSQAAGTQVSPSSCPTWLQVGVPVAPSQVCQNSGETLTHVTALLKEMMKGRDAQPDEERCGEGIGGPECRGFCPRGVGVPHPRCAGVLTHLALSEPASLGLSWGLSHTGEMAIKPTRSLLPLPGSGGRATSPQLLSPWFLWGPALIQEPPVSSLGQKVLLSPGSCEGPGL